VFCDSNPVTATIQHVVTLGVFCSDLPPDDPYFFADLYFECTDSTDQFDVLSDDTLFNTTTDRYSCSAYKMFAPSSTSSNPQIISSVAITTDDTWLSSLDDTCYTQYVSAAPVVSPSPTVAMNIASPSVFPTLPPLDASISPPTNPSGVAAAVPNQDSATTPTLSGESTESSNKNDNGVLIGGVVGGIAAVIVIGSMIGLLVWPRKSDSGDTQKPEVNIAKLSVTEGTEEYDNFRGSAAAVSATQQLSPVSAVPPAPSVSVMDKQPPSPVPAVPPASPGPVSAQQPSSSSSSPLSVPTATNYVVDYKDQARPASGAIPAVAVAEYVPLPYAVAVDMNVESGVRRTSQRSEPPGRIFMEM
jgi:hypothetical protein